VTDPDEHTRQLAAESSDATAWFERLYAEAELGAAVVPWDAPDPHFLLADWAGRRTLHGTGRRALVVGAGLGRDAEFIAGFGFDTTAFDVSPTAIAAARQRHAGSAVHYRVADLFAPPAEWHHAFDLVVESLTVQALPVDERGPAIAQVPRFVAPGGTLVVIAAGRDDGVPPGDGPPWPLDRAELDGFATDGVEPVHVAAIRDPAEQTSLRWQAEFRRPPA
jgi:SAM-dependent methyltransferase